MLRSTTALLAVATALLVTPVATADTATGTSSTGNVDTYGVGTVLPTKPLVQMCPDDFFTRIIRLTLLDASPGDAVGLAQLADRPGFGSSSDPLLAPAAVATYENPVAEIAVTLGGCNRQTTVAVVGLLVEGEVSYTLSH